MIVDERVSLSSLRQFATQKNHLPQQVCEDFDNAFNGDQPDEFYAGLLAGLSTAYQMGMMGMPLQQLGAVMAMTAAFMEKKEIV